jgi:hypothetical protein
VARATGPLIHLGTRCGTIDEFVERFAPFATEDSLVMPTASEVAPGTEGRFVIHLKDRTPVMGGRCRVEEVRPVSSGGSGSSGRMVMRVRLLGMDEPSRNVHKQLLACKRPAAPPAPPAVPSLKPPALRIVRSPTLIGAAASSSQSPPVTLPPPVAVPPPPIGTASTLIGTAPTLIGTLAPPVPSPLLPPLAPPPITGDELDKTNPSIKMPETQAPSAAFTLPANPLSDLEANDLSSFIECTLFESDVDPDAAVEREPEEAGAKIPNALAQDDATPKPAETSLETPTRSTARVPRVDVIGDDVEPLSPNAQLKARLMQAAPYAFCTVLGVLVGALLRGSTPAPPPARPALAAAAPAEPAPAPAPPAVAPAPPAVAAPAPAPPPPAPAAAAEAPEEEAAPPTAGSCLVSVSSEPSEAEVLWGAKVLGQTPLKAVAVPCGAATITLRHERYRDARRAVTASSARPLVVSERLHRPNGRLWLSSSPPRAIFTVNQLEVGPAPRKVSEWRYETVHVEAKLPGYQPWARTIYLKEEVTKLSAQLVPVKKPDTRGAMRMPAAGAVRTPALHR